MDNFLKMVNKKHQRLCERELIMEMIQFILNRRFCSFLPARGGSIRDYVGPSVGLSFGPSVGLSVGPCQTFFALTEHLIDLLQGGY